MNLINVLLDKQFKLTLLENNKTDNIIFCKPFEDTLHNLCSYTTKNEDFIYRYVLEDDERFIITDILLEDGTLYKKVKFKLVTINENEVPYSVINFKSLTSGEKANKPVPTKPIIVKEHTVPVPKYDTREDINKVKLLEQELLKERTRIENEKKILSKQKLLVDNQNTIQSTIESFKEELIQEFHNISQRQESLFQGEVSSNVTKINEQLNNYIKEYESQIIELFKKTKTDQNNTIDKQFTQLNENLNNKLKDNKKEFISLIETVRGKNLLEIKEQASLVQDTFDKTVKKLQTDVLLELKESLETNIQERKQELEALIENKSDDYIIKVVEKADELKSLFDEKLATDLQQYKEKLIVEMVDIGRKFTHEFLEQGKIQTREEIKSHIKTEQDSLQQSFDQNVLDLKAVLEKATQQIDNHVPFVEEKIKLVQEKINELDKRGNLLREAKENILLDSKKYTDTKVSQAAEEARNYARRILDLGGGGGSVASQFTDGGTMNGDLNVNGNYLSGGVNLLDIFALQSDLDNQTLSYNDSNYNLSISNGNTVNLSAINSTFNANSGKYESVYTVASSNSAYWADIRNNVTFEKNVTIQGNLTALGISTFQNTVFTTTSALSVVNLGSGPALYVFQASGPYDVASFYDGDGIEVLHVGNAQGGGNPLGQVGINTSDPSAELTVNGAISSNGVITVLGGNSNQWNSNYTTTRTNSANWSNWSTVSASYALGSQYVKLSGDTMTGTLSVGSGGNLFSPSFATFVKNSAYPTLSSTLTNNSGYFNSQGTFASPGGYIIKGHSPYNNTIIQNLPGKGTYGMWLQNVDNMDPGVTFVSDGRAQVTHSMTFRSGINNFTGGSDHNHVQWQGSPSNSTQAWQMTNGGNATNVYGYQFPYTNRFMVHTLPQYQYNTTITAISGFIDTREANLVTGTDRVSGVKLLVSRDVSTGNYNLLNVGEVVGLTVAPGLVGLVAATYNSQVTQISANASLSSFQFNAYIGNGTNWIPAQKGIQPVSLLSRTDGGNPGVSLVTSQIGTDPSTQYVGLTGSYRGINKHMLARFTSSALLTGYKTGAPLTLWIPPLMPSSSPIGTGIISSDKITTFAQGTFPTGVRSGYFDAYVVSVSGTDLEFSIGNLMDSYSFENRSWPFSASGTAGWLLYGGSQDTVHRPTFGTTGFYFEREPWNVGSVNWLSGGMVKNVVLGTSESYGNFSYGLGWRGVVLGDKSGTFAGDYNTVFGNNSVALGGEGLISLSSTSHQAVVGRYNNPNNNALLVVGAGTNNTNRTNILEVEASKVTINGALSTTVLSADSVFLKGTTRVTSTNDTNVFIGDSTTGSSTLTGTHNYIFGRFTGTQLTSSSNNFFAGLSVGPSLKQIDNNVFLGQGAVGGVSYARESNYSTLPAVCKVQNNFVAGNQAGFSLGQVSKNNRYRQYDSCGNLYYSYNQYCVASKNNILIGYKAGCSSNHRACNNIFLGYCAGAFNGTSASCNNVVMGYKAGAGMFNGCGNTIIGCCAGFKNNTGQDNTFIGFRSGQNNTYGCCNTFIGREAGQNNTTGSQNIFIGGLAGLNNTTGIRNTFLGGRAGLNNTTGCYNTFIGYRVGYRNTCGNYNTFIGRLAGFCNTCGSNNFFLGNNAGYCNTTGRNNNFLGSLAGRRFTTGCNNNFFGSNAGGGFDVNSTGSNNNFLGYETGCRISTGANNNFLGYKAGRLNVTGSNNNFFGNSAGRNNNGNNNTFIGSSAGYSNITGCSNTFIGSGAGGTNSSGCDNNFLGDNAGASSSNGCSNNFFGKYTGMLNSTGSNNNFLGNRAGYYNCGGNNNNFLGFEAGRCGTGSNNNFLGNSAGRRATGSNNNFLGNSAGCANTTGACNNFIGYRAGCANTGGCNNNFFGRCAGLSNTTGNYNNFIGNNAGRDNTTGNNNTFIGRNAGCTNTTGANNIIIGNGANVSTNALSGVIALGTGALASTNNQLVIGSTTSPVSGFINGNLSVTSFLSAANISLANANVITPASVTDSGQYLIININGTSQAMRLFNYTT